MKDYVYVYLTDISALNFCYALRLQSTELNLGHSKSIETFVFLVCFLFDGFSRVSRLRLEIGFFFLVQASSLDAKH